MNESDLLNRGFIKQLDGTWSKPNRADDPRNGTHTQLQEHQAGSSQGQRHHVHHDAKRHQTMDEAAHRKFRVTVNLRYATNRNGPDPDGSLATIMDCIVRA